MTSVACLSGRLSSIHQMRIQITTRYLKSGRGASRGARASALAVRAAVPRRGPAAKDSATYPWGLVYPLCRKRVDTSDGSADLNSRSTLRNGTLADRGRRGQAASGFWPRRPRKRDPSEPNNWRHRHRPPLAGTHGRPELRGAGPGFPSSSLAAAVVGAEVAEDK